MWLAIAIGGAIGSVARYLVSVALSQLYGEVVPLAVAVVNIVGCFITGLGAGAATTDTGCPPRQYERLCLWAFSEDSPRFKALASTRSV